MPRQYDLEFMGRMLGMHTCPDCDEPENARLYVGRHMLDPIANARAQRNIGELLGALERLELLAEMRAEFDLPEPAPEFN